MRVRRGQLVDLYAENERCVVMVGESVLVLTEVATAIVEAVPPGSVVAIDEVAAHVVDVFGDPEPPHTAQGLTLQHVHDLVAHGVLVEEEEGDGDGFRGSLRSHLNQRREDGSHLNQRREDAVEAVRSVLRHIRSEESGVWSLPPEVSPDDFVAAAHQHHVVAFLAHHLDRLALPPRAHSVLQADAARLHAGAHVLAGDLTRALDALDRAGVRALAFKGLALAVQAHGELAARGAGDLDLLVAPMELEAAYSALTGAGWSAAANYPELGSSWAWRHLLQTNNELTLTSPTSAIDLHWHLAPARGTFPAFDELWERHDVVRIHDYAVPTLSKYDALAHSAGHTARDGWRWLRSLLDIHLLASQRGTWQAADRPLRSDQILSLGVCARLFGVPRGAPEVVVQAVSRSASMWEDALAEQVRTAPFHLQAPALSLLFRLRAAARTDGALKEFTRRLSRSSLPPRLTRHETSPHAAVAVPRVLLRRTHEIVRRLRSS